MTPCDIAIGHEDKDGYVTVYDPVTKNRISAHRLAWRTVHGTLPRLLRHTCDNRKCRNLEHLEEGTQLDNMQDMVARGRLGLRLGATNNQATLPDSKVAEIVAAYTGKRGELTALGKRFGVSRVTISNYVTGRYRHVNGNLGRGNDDSVKL